MLTGLRKTAALALQDRSRLAQAGVHVQQGIGQAAESRRRPLSFVIERPPHAAERSVGWWMAAQPNFRDSRGLDEAAT